MPSKGYRNFSIREEVYQRLKGFMEEKGITNISDAVVYLLDSYDTLRKLLDRQG